MEITRRDDPKAIHRKQPGSRTFGTEIADMKKPGDVLLSHGGERGSSESTAFARVNAASIPASGRTMSKANGPTFK